MYIGWRAETTLLLLLLSMVLRLQGKGNSKEPNRQSNNCLLWTGGRALSDEGKQNMH